VLFRVARGLTVRPTEDGASAVVIAAGEVVQLAPQFDTGASAHVIWKKRHFAVDRGLFLQRSSPIGPAPD
jgi:hypothetical protein